MIGRVAALVALVGAILAVVLLLGGGSDYEVTAEFENASQLVKGNEVVVGGSSVGTVKSIELGDHGQALVTFSVNEDYAPLMRGTVATVRSPSLSQIAGRQVQLTLPPDTDHGDAIPNGGTLGEAETVSAVDLDQLFNTLDPKTINDFKHVIKGMATSYDGVGPRANRGLHYLNPFLSTGRQVFAELNSDQRAFENLIVDTSHLSGALAQRAPDISALIGNLNSMMNAIGDRKQQLADAISLLPNFLRESNTTFVNLRAALDDLDPLVDASKPVAVRLQPFLATLRAASADAVPTFRDLSAILRRPGNANDLVELTREQPALAKAAVGTGSPDCGSDPTDLGDLSRAQDDNFTQGALGESVCALRNSAPQLSMFRAYTPELVGWFDDFGHSGFIDAIGGIGRIGTTLNPFSLSLPGGVPNLLDPLTPDQISRLARYRQRSALSRRQRAPGRGHRPVRSLGAVHRWRRAHRRRPRSLRPQPDGSRLMRRIVLIAALIVAPVIFVAATAGADDTHTYKIEMYNAFGLVTGSDVRIAGVNAGTVTDLDVTPQKRAVVTVELSGKFGVLGRDSKCSSEPQSLIAEYFITCDPAGPPLPDGGTIPASQVAQTVQNDLVQDTLRLPYTQRLQLLINEFGTALAGNPDELNQAIKLGAPAIGQLHKITSILASQNRIIRDLNANSDTVIGKLTQRREDVVRFIEEARQTADASLARRDALSTDFNKLDDFLAQLKPTLAKLGDAARANTPVLANLRAAAPGLNRLALNLPAFSNAAKASLGSLGQAATVGTTALRRGRDEIRLLADAGAKAPETGEILADFLRDIDDPRRAVEIDDRAQKDTGRTDPRAGKRDTKGYTGLEGILNYAYYQAGALNQYDQVGHLLHFSLYDIYTGPCGSFSSGHDATTGAPGVPAQGGGTTTNLLDAADCVGWLGPNQPGISQNLGLPSYDPSVCPNGTAPTAAKALCDPNNPAKSRATSGGNSAGSGRGSGSGTGTSTESAPDAGSTGQSPTGHGGGDAGASGGGGAPGTTPDDILDQILNLPPSATQNLPPALQDELDQLGGGSTDSSQQGTPDSQAAGDLLDFLFSN